MRLILLLLSLAATAARAESGQLRGVDAVSRVLDQRVYHGGIAAYVISACLNDDRGIRQILETLPIAGAPSGRPAPLNFVVWYALSDCLAHDLVRRACEVNIPNGVQPTFYAALRASCNGDRASIPALWRALLAFDAPAAEGDAWAALAQNAATPADWVEALDAAFLNPYFLLNP